MTIHYVVIKDKNLEFHFREILHEHRKCAVLCHQVIEKQDLHVCSYLCFTYI